jgi:hypothetical protein
MKAAWLAKTGALALEAEHRACEKQMARVITLAKLWAREVETRPVLSSRSHHLLRAIQKLERMS